MYDWNKNGKYDSFDSYVDYNLANSEKTYPSKSRRQANWESSPWWFPIVFVIVTAIFPPAGILMILWMLLY